MKTINEIVLWNCSELGDEIVSKVGDEIVMQILDKSDLAGGCFVCKLGRLMWPTCLPKNSGLIRLNGQIYPGPWWGLPPESGYLSKWWNSRFRRCWHHNGPRAGWYLVYILEKLVGEMIRMAISYTVFGLIIIIETTQLQSELCLYQITFGSCLTCEVLK